jgi:hypothetical protein
MICGVALGVYFFIIKPLTRRLFINLSDQEPHGFKILERALVIIALVIVFVTFLLVNPILHGFLLLVFIFLAKDLLVNVILGAMLIKEFDLEEGTELSIKGFEGVLYKLGWTGIHLSSVQNIDFIPYRYIYRFGISKSQKFVPSLARVKCTHETIHDNRQLLSLLKSKLIHYPFLLEGSMPDFIINASGIEMSVGLISTKHLNSLIDSLQMAGFNVEILENT